MNTCLYAKFLGKALPLDQAKLALADAWRGLGNFSVADLPNGFYFINCESEKMQCHLLYEGPWTVAGRILQLSPWSESFQPAFERLSVAAVWIQLYHLPMELWKGEILEMIASQFGRVIKIDEHTIDRSRAKFARVCIELDLEQPLQQGTWVKYGGYSVFTLVLYEKLPVFCYKCGKVGHGEAKCTLVGSQQRSGQPVPSIPEEMETVQADSETFADEAMGIQDGFNDAPPPTQPPQTSETGEFGPWLKPSRRLTASRGRGGGSGGGRGGRRNNFPSRQYGDDELGVDTWPPAWAAEGHVATSWQPQDNSGGIPNKEGYSRLSPTKSKQTNPNPEDSFPVGNSLNVGIEKSPQALCLENCAEAALPVKSTLSVHQASTINSTVSTPPIVSLSFGKPNSRLSEITSLSKELHPPSDPLSGPSRIPDESSEPMLISSITLPTHSNSLEDQHLLAVAKMADALAESPHSDQSMEGSSSDEFGPSFEVDDEMTLSHAQKALKSEAIARRAPSKRGTKTKKGRSSPLN